MTRAGGDRGAWARGLAWRAGAVTLTAVALAVGLVGAAGAAGAKKPSGKQCLNQLYAGASARIQAGTTPASVLASYAVLRRPQAPSDVPPAAATLHGLLTGRLSSYDPSLTRLLQQTSAGSVYLVVGIAPVGRPTLSAACRRAGGPTVAVLAQELRLDWALEGTGPAYALIDVPAVTHTGSTMTASAPMAFATSFALSGFSGPSELDQTGHTLVALVPDGVGAVTVALAPSVGSFSLTAQNNLAVGAGPAINASPTLRTSAERRRFLNRVIPVTVTWLTAPNGSTVRVFARPAGLVDQYLTLLRVAFQLLSDLMTSGTSVNSASGCAPAKRHGKTVEVCTTITTTCTPRRVDGKVKQRCRTTKKVTVTKPKG